MITLVPRGWRIDEVLNPYPYSSLLHPSTATIGLGCRRNEPRVSLDLAGVGKERGTLRLLALCSNLPNLQGSENLAGFCQLGLHRIFRSRS